MGSVRLGIVTMGGVGWYTVRRRWEDGLADEQPIIGHIEDHAQLIKGLTDRYGARSVGANLAGRAAAQAAIGRGANVILFTTLQNASLLPLRKDVKYLIYGDCTDRDLANLYLGNKPRLPGSLLSQRIKSLAQHRCLFLCMSRWYLEALRDQFDISVDRLIHLPFCVDTDRWAPLANKPSSIRKKVLFIGADLARKGGDILYEMASLPQFAHVEFHIVSPNALPGPPNVHAHRSLRADTVELIRLTAESDVLVLPTRADISPIAIIEAAACGIPAIVSNRGAISELVKDGFNGSVLAESKTSLFAEALTRYLSDPRLLKQQGLNARQNVEENFGIHRHLDLLRQAIERAASEL